jgi:iron complex transport system substrate-binding protein
MAESKDSVEQGNIRIVSLAPSLTEIVFALGSGPRLVGVTRFCDFPPEARKIHKVGGLVDPNLETILSLNADLVIGMPEHAAIANRLDSFNIKTSLYRQGSIEEILNSIESIGEQIGKTPEARTLVSEFRSKIASITSRVVDTSKPNVLVAVGGHVRPGVLDSIYAAGPGTIYDEMIDLAGGINVLRSGIEYAKLSSEGLFALNPDIIIDLIPAKIDSTPDELKQVRIKTLTAWNTLSRLQAVSSKRVYVFDQEFIVNPGPRTIETLELFSHAIHPRSDVHARR